MATPTLLRWISTLLRAIAIFAVVFVLAGLLGFLTDEVRDSSKSSSTRIAIFNEGTHQTKTVDITQPDPPADVERAREQQHTKAREFIDDVGDVVMSPFSWATDGLRAFVQRLVDSGLALLLYGVLGLVLADRARRYADQIRRDMLRAKDEKAARERRESGTFVSPA